MTYKRGYVLATILSLFSVSTYASSEPVCNNQQICELGTAAEAAFFAGWATGDWSDFRSMLNQNDLVFQFPDGPFKGRSSGEEGYKNINLWIDHHIETENRIHQSERNLRFGLDDWYYFADEATGYFYGKEYVGSHMIGFRFTDGKIVEYREYVGDLTHWK
ncbi:nuclear transport factor 2 family protein [Vibrio tubiashii]|uniref:nuclear transport factor 2 family protein n=1 Tax=Vibrio tubiashii TaxID=29498 RepID=UPI00234E5F9B|nr:nuclear transport factor 2 family protein [Vibrio tubiashii]WCP68984.1 nuclear transport factor 2 family protein [Vibrio tubiashii]